MGNYKIKGLKSSVRPKQKKLVSAEYRIFGRFHRIFGRFHRIFGRITAQILTIFEHNFSQNSSHFKMGKIQGTMQTFNCNQMKNTKQQNYN